jgi:hypothetical protein
MKKLTNEVINRTIDVDTGEIIQITDQKTYRVSNEPDFIKLYLNDLVKLQNLPPSANNILYLLLQNMDYQNRIYITKSIKENVIKKLNISLSSLEKAVKGYIDKGLITKLDSSTYLTNPEIFGRGSWQNVKEIRMLVSYSSKGRMLLNYDEYSKKVETPTLFDKL